jgi:hypothetical protein
MGTFVDRLSKGRIHTKTDSTTVESSHAAIRIVYWEAMKRLPGA